MNNNPYSDEAIYDIVTNDDGFVSVWRSNKFVPAGWRKAGFTGTRRDCLSRIESFAHSTPVRQLGASATIYDMFQKQAALHPSRPAIVTDNTSISYERLAAITSGIRTILDNRDGVANTVVAVMLERSSTYVASALAIFGSGAALLPLDPSYPGDRLDYMLSDTNASVLITDSRGSASLAAPGRRVININQHKFDSLMIAPGNHPPAARHSSDLSYIMYTSGSTGRPKGVMCTHTGVMNRLNWMLDEFDISHNDRILQKTPLIFDVSIWEMFLPLICGGCTVLAKHDGHLDSPYIARLIEEKYVTIAQFLPPMLQFFLDNHSKKLKRLRYAFCGGDTLHARTVSEFKDSLNAELINIYGPTEASIGVTFWRAGYRADGVVPIGIPLPNVDVYLLNEDLEQVRSGEDGEICIGGVQLATGYIGKPGLTAEKFVPDPFSRSERLYRTGDFARRTSDGQLEFTGRLDFQIKIRGHRIELQEIERVMMEHQDVSQAVVIVKKFDDSDNLVCVAASNRRDRDLKLELALLARKKLPYYMIPVIFIAVDTLPCEANGKVSRQKIDQILPAMLHNNYDQPRPGRESEILTIFSRCLGGKKIGVNTNFFLAGGSSLSAFVAISELNKRLTINLGVGSIIAHPTAFELSRSIDLSSPASLRTDNSLVSLTSREGAHNVFFIHPVGGTVFRYLALASSLPHSYNAYGLQASGIESGEVPDSSIEAMATRYIASIKSVQPCGPYRLVGWSFGGLVAFETAFQLRVAGDPVASVVLLDTPLPSRDVHALSDAYAWSVVAGQLAGTQVSKSELQSVGNISDLESLLTRIGLPQEIHAREHLERVFRVVKAAILAGRGYRPQRLDATVTFVKATRPDGLYAPYGADFDWSKMLHNSPRVVEVACSHFDLGQPEMAPVVSTIVARALPGSPVV